MRPRHLLTAAAFVIASSATFGCSSGFEPGTTSTAEQAIQKVCYTNIGGVTGVYPANASYPLGNQRVFCEHQVTAFGSGSYPPNTVACTGPVGGVVPGLFQVDVWTEVNTSPETYKCARINVPTGPGAITYHLAYREVMERGWLGQWGDPIHNVHVQGFVLGPGTTMISSSLQDVYVSGCVPSTACSGTAIVHQNQPATWFTIDVQVPSMTSFWLGPTT